MSLATFFREAGAVIAGERPATATEASAPYRLGFYAWLIAHDLAGVLEGRFGHVKRAMDAEDPSLWSTSVRRFSSAVPPVHGDLDRWCAPFSEYLYEQASEDVRLLPAAEIADFQWALHRVGVAPDSSVEPRMDVSLMMRRFTHRVPWYCRDNATSPPARGETVVLVYRSLRSRRPSWVVPSEAMLVELGAHLGLALPPGQARDEGARLEMIRLGLIGEKVKAGEI